MEKEYIYLFYNQTNSFYRGGPVDRGVSFEF